MKYIRIYDCSNSSERPPHRLESNGPKENDIMRGLKKHCKLFSYEFIDQPQDADVIVTNDVYPKDILTLDKPRVKRMDGVYFLNRLKDRNEPLNKAAMESDSVIFISQYSKHSFLTLYGKHPYPDMLVIPNRVDDSIYFPLPKRINGFSWVASASNWSREEKRYADLMVFAKEVKKSHQLLFLIGQCDDDEYIPGVERIGYIDDESEMNRVLNLGILFINLSYRDPAPKVVCQAVNCNLPILYADSGGTSEMVNSGISINDDSDYVFEDKVPRLKVEDMKRSYGLFLNNYWELFRKAEVRKFGYMEMISTYFWKFSDAIYNHRFHKQNK